MSEGKQTQGQKSNYAFAKHVAPITDQTEHRPWEILPVEPRFGNDDARAKNATLLLSPEDDDLRGYNWCLDRDEAKEQPYWLAFTSRKEGEARKNVYLHRVVLQRMLGRPLVRGETVDHINGNRQDNRRENLRKATYSKQNRNSKKRGITSIFHGVHYIVQTGRWRVRLRDDSTGRQLSKHFDWELEAADFYNAHVEEFKGEFGRKNDLCAYGNNLKQNITDIPLERRPEAQVRPKGLPSPSALIHHDASTDMWQAKVKRGDKVVFVGRADTAQDALKLQETYLKANPECYVPQRRVSRNARDAARTDGTQREDLATETQLDDVPRANRKTRVSAKMIMRK